MLTGKCTVNRIDIADGFNVDELFKTALEQCPRSLPSNPDNAALDWASRHLQRHTGFQL